MTDRRRMPDFTVPEAQPFLLAGGPHGVLLLHGFTGSAAHMRPLGEMLHGAGFTVMGPNLPGHAATPEAMGRTGWADWYQAARDSYRMLKGLCPTVSCAGLSMGGLLALMLAEHGEVASVTTISTPMGVRNMPPLSLARPAAFVRPAIWWHAGDRERLLDQRYDLGYPWFPTRCGADLGHLIRLARRDLSAIACPLLTIQSTGDSLVIPESAAIIRSGVRSGVRRDLTLRDVPHTCTISTALPQIAGAMTDHLNSIG